MQDATTKIASRVNFSNYQAVAIFDVAKIKEWGYWGFAMPDMTSGFYTSSGYIRNSLEIGYEYGLNNPPSGFKTSVLKHELGHLFGFIDLYIIAPGNYFIGQTPGPFDVMNATSGPAHEFLAWQRWLQGWIPDSNVTCLNFATPTSTVQLKPLGKSTLGTQMIVIKINSQKALVLESRKATSTDSLSGNEGLLAYEIDLSVPSLQGPIRIIPRATELTLAALSPDLQDTDRFLEGTAKTGEYIRYRDVLIENVLGDVNGESIKIYKGEEAIARQRDLDKLAQRIKLEKFNTLQKARTDGTLIEAEDCIEIDQNFTVQILDENRTWKNFATEQGSTRDSSCNYSYERKPYAIAKIPPRTFFRVKIEYRGKNYSYYEQTKLSNISTVASDAQVAMEISLAKLEGNYHQDTCACHGANNFATVQIEKNGVFEDYAEATGWVKATNCGNSDSVQPYILTRFSSGTRFRFKLQNGGWDRDYFTSTYTSDKTALDRLKETEAASTELTKLVSPLRSDKTSLENSLALTQSQLLTATNEILSLQATMASQRSTLEGINGELLTAKSKLEGDVATLTQKNQALQAKVDSLSKKSIICTKGTVTKKVTGINPTCPTGYKKKT